ncbi:MAG: DNA-binding response regulator [Gammaproteobacteria bacterium]|nr:MAG: DNA-binding response regulator [Gammaproteobacteria bacterium]
MNPSLETATEPNQQHASWQVASSPIRILIADDHPPLREGLSALLERQTDLRVTAMAADGEEAVALFRQYQPDVVLMDLRMPRLEGADAVAAICREWTDARIIVLTTFDGDEDIYRALRAGAWGYLLKDVPCEELFAAIRQVHRGKKYIMSQVAQKLTERFQGADLTDRELEVLQLLVQGKSNRDISEALCVVEGTVKFHVRNILEKLGACDRTQAVTIALKRGLARL